MEGGWVFEWDAIWVIGSTEIWVLRVPPLFIKMESSFDCLEEEEINVIHEIGDFYYYFFAVVSKCKYEQVYFREIMFTLF